MVSQDNLVFLCEKQVFTNSFFQCTLDLLNLMLKHNPDVLEEGHPMCEKIFRFVERLVFDILPMTSENKCLMAMT
jgi:hypothetical protein